MLQQCRKPRIASTARELQQTETGATARSDSEEFCRAPGAIQRQATLRRHGLNLFFALIMNESAMNRSRRLFPKVVFELAQVRAHTHCQHRMHMLMSHHSGLPRCVMVNDMRGGQLMPSVFRPVPRLGEWSNFLVEWRNFWCNFLSDRSGTAHLPSPDQLVLTFLSNRKYEEKPTVG